MKYNFIFLTIFLFLGCQEEREGPTAEEVVNKTIENSGGQKYKKATIDFEFRGNTYWSIRNDGEYQLERKMVDSTSNYYKDVLNNTGYQRFKNDTIENIPDSIATKYSSSLNSVHYFAHLPYGLSDRAVKNELEGEAIIKGEPYHQLKVTFEQEGGGADHHDEFMYWIHKEKYTIDYLAYKFLVNNGGIRFRVAFNPRIIEGIRFVDYYNYKTDDFNTDLSNLDELYEAGELNMFSTIETDILNVK